MTEIDAINGQKINLDDYKHTRLEIIHRDNLWNNPNMILRLIKRYIKVIKAYSVGSRLDSFELYK